MRQDASQGQLAPAPQRWQMFAWASVAGLAAAFVFVGFPQLDFAVTNLFYGGNRAFIFNFPGAGKDMRVFFKLIFFAAIAVVVVGLFISALLNRKFLSFGFPQWLYLVVCLALGPGITANVIFKDNWGRARPFHVEEYGGAQKFTPALVRSDQCEDNCSFVSGEASSIYMMFFALAMVSRRRRARLVALGLLGGTLAGFIRIAQGGHFLSDVVFAGVLMALIADLLHWVIFDLGERSMRHEGPAHKRILSSVHVVSQAAKKAGQTARTRSQTFAKARSGPAEPGQAEARRQPAVRTETTDPVGPVTSSVLIDDSSSGGPGCYWFESPGAIISAESAEEVEGALAAMDRALADGAYLAGFFAYELGYVFEPRLLAHMPASRALPLLWFGVFDAPRQLTSDEVNARLRQKAGANYSIGPINYSISQENYAKPFARVKEYIAAGDVYQLNLTFKAKFDFAGDAACLYADMRAVQPVSHGAFIQTPRFSLLSASPELFLARREGRIFTRPMKGTAARAPGAEADQAQQDWLASDLKSRAENLMIVDLMRNDFGRIAEIGSVKVDDIFTVETFPTLHQMTSGVSATLREGVDLPELVRSIFPPGSVTGAPKVRAVEILSELETEPRGAYTGTIGMLTPTGEARFNVAIRTVTIAADGGAEIGIGSGIVQDSVMQDEYAECLLKMRFLETASKSFQLIETMLFDPDEGYYLLERHLERMAVSAATFGFVFKGANIERILEREAARFGGTHQRVRLLLGRDGEATLSATPIEVPSGQDAMTYVFSDQSVSSRDLFCFTRQPAGRSMTENTHG